MAYPTIDTNDDGGEEVDRLPTQRRPYFYVDVDHRRTAALRIAQHLLRRMSVGDLDGDRGNPSKRAIDYAAMVHIIASTSAANNK